MGHITGALIFLAIYAASIYGAYWLKAKYLPENFTGSRVISRIIGFGLVFLGILCITLWGFNPTPISIGANNIVLNPLRWFWWLIGAALLGLAEGFISDARNQKLLAEAREELPPPRPTPVKVPRGTDV